MADQNADPSAVAALLAQVDWQQPWLVPYRADAARVMQHLSWQAGVNALAVERGLRNHAGAAITFVAQAELPAATAYETFISQTGRVPSRDNLHDFFNALVWLRCPASKARLNALQAMEIDRRAQQAGSGMARAGNRGPLRDRATLFDENAALLLCCDPEIEAALRGHDWQQALVMRRQAFGAVCEVHLFGHALIEKLVTPYKAITAHMWALPVTPDFFTLGETMRQTRIDRLLETTLRAGLLTVPYMTLPVLGVPGWWPLQDAAFYADSEVFRPLRLR